MLLWMLGLPAANPSDGQALRAPTAMVAGGAGAQPFLRWAGSKRKLVDRLSKYWSDRYARYVEPFAGSACLFFQLGPARAILGDINRDLIETFVQVKENTSAVLSSLSSV